MKTILGMLIISLVFMSSKKEIIGIPATGTMMREKNKINVNVKLKLSNNLSLATGTMLKN
ncbi:MAG: hypothetical protein ACRC6K_05330 [Fusobacteriaceae bacterium]